MYNTAFAEENVDGIWQEIWQEIKKVKSRYDVAVKIAIVGFGKSGKSTLFNAIFGKTLQETGAQTDLTGAEREESLFGTIFTDTRGFGSSTRSCIGNKNRPARSKSHNSLYKRDGGHQ